jgi:hypothetical protein
MFSVILLIVILIIVILLDVVAPSVQGYVTDICVITFCYDYFSLGHP